MGSIRFKELNTLDRHHKRKFDILGQPRGLNTDDS